MHISCRYSDADAQFLRCYNGRNDVIDDFDRAILRILQENNTHTHQVIGERVGLSGSAVRRRILRLRETGVIRKEVALLDTEKMGVSVMTIVAFGQESLALYADFERQIKKLPEVQQCYHIAGESDFMLISHVPDLQYYEEWAKQQFMNNPAIRRYDTKIIYSCKKFETAIPV